MPLKLSRNDAIRAAMGCRALAIKNREQAAALVPPSYSRENFETEAAHLDRLAAMFQAHADSRLDSEPELPAKS